MKSTTFKMPLSQIGSRSLARFIAGLRDRRPLLKMMGEAVREKVRAHLVYIANNRHETANRLGATPTGHWKLGAEKVARPEALSVDAAAARLVINQPGITRAVHDVVIKPGAGKKFLTIPGVAATYGLRYAAALRLYGVPSERDPSKTVLPKLPNGLRWYYYVPEVRQKRDPSLLPTDAEIRRAGKEGALSYMDLLITFQRQGGLA